MLFDTKRQNARRRSDIVQRGGGSGWRWQKIRKAVLMENPLCAACERAGRISAAEEVDHIIALINGGTDDRHNLEGLCKACHAKKTADDLGYKTRGADESGMPTDPRHHWSR